MTIGYARVSREDQDLGRQIKALSDAGCQRIFEDKISGAKAHRPNLEALITTLQPGDLVVVQKLDRLGRSLQHLIELVMNFKAKQVGFKSLTEGFDTTTSAGELMFHVMGALAQFERSLISERTKNSLAYKKSLGVRLGRPEKDDTKMIRKFRALKEQGMKRDEIREKLNLSLYKYYDLNKALKSEPAPC